MEIWSKTLLYSYRHLNAVADAIDEMVKKLTLSSMCYNLRAKNDTMSQINKIMELNERKINLINLKVMVETCLVQLPQKDMEFITLFYLDGMSIADISDTLEISVRTAYRRKRNSLINFAKILTSNYAKEDFFNIFREETWLFDLYDYNLKEAKVIRLDEESVNKERYQSGREIFKAIKALRKVAI